MYSSELSQVKAFESGETVDPDTLVFRDYDHFTAILAELEAANNGTNWDLMLEDDGIRTVDHQVVSIFTHNAE